MESSVACELWNDAPKDHVKLSAYVGDDDTTTLSHLTKNVSYGVEKLSDIIHAKRSLATRLHNLSSSRKFQDSSVLSQKVINYLTKCFSYCIAQNSNADNLKLALNSLCLMLLIGEHQLCNDSWCGYKKDPSTYKHHSLPNGKDLHGAKLKQALSRLVEEYATDIVVKKLVSFANSQRNESFNNIISSKNPKIHFY
jgi:hypothetical protein